MGAQVRTFLIDSNVALGDRLCNEHWLIKLAYLTDIFNKVTEVSLSLQEKTITVFNANDKIQAYRKKLIFWTKSAKNKNLDSFSLITEFREELESDIAEAAFSEFHTHLLSLLVNFHNYFTEEFHDKIKENFWLQIHTFQC
ncbi:zinc finger BED domain-containing protein 5-like [Diabrotica undecimpunctata]|uniref:zinc finger BED domain-containing protein 5-like n=1 Tax=Diabrotica undecimpunctata TaxID=50387 RepID=UPI003B6393DB